MLNCREATKLMSEAQEKPLALKTRFGLEVHLMMCSGCHNFKEQMAALRTMSHEYARGKDEQEKK